MPRAGLSSTTVVAEAACLVDEVGWEQLTMAALADRLGVRLPSLYKHIDSLDGLRRSIGLLALSELLGVLSSAAVGRAGVDALRAVSRAYRAYANSHPGRYVATIRAPGAGDAARAALAESLLGVVRAVLAGYGLQGDAAIDATRVLRAGLHGFVSLEAAGGFGIPQDLNASFEALIWSLHGSLTRWGAMQDTPALAGRSRRR